MEKVDLSIAMSVLLEGLLCHFSLNDLIYHHLHCISKNRNYFGGFAHSYHLSL